MKDKNKQDNLERFFQKSLRNFEEDPGAEFWDRIAPIIPDRPIAPPGSKFYKRWIIVLSFVLGVLVSSLYFHWRLNNERMAWVKAQIQQNQQSIEVIKEQIAEKPIETLETETRFSIQKNQSKKERNN